MGESSPLIKSNATSSPCSTDTSTQIMNRFNSCSSILTVNDAASSSLKCDRLQDTGEEDDVREDEKVPQQAKASATVHLNVKGYRISSNDITSGDELARESLLSPPHPSLDTIGSSDTCEISASHVVTAVNGDNSKHANDSTDECTSKHDENNRCSSPSAESSRSSSAPASCRLSNAPHDTLCHGEQLNPPDSSTVKVQHGQEDAECTGNDTIWPLTTTSSTHSHMDLGSEDDEDAYEGGVDEDDDEIEEDDLSDDYYLSDGSQCSSSNTKSACKSLDANPLMDDFLYTRCTVNNNVMINGKQYDMSCKRYAVLSYDQVVRLDQVMDTVIPIHGRGNFPTLEVKLKDLVQVVRYKLQSDCVDLRDIRLNGGAASFVLSSSSYNSYSYTDLDLIFGVNLHDTRNFDKVRTAVLDSLLHFLPSGVNRNKMNSCTLKEAYVHKMVKVTEGSDRWSLISLCNNNGRDIEIKFVDTMKRQFEFSVDSFQIILDSLLLYYECSSTTTASGKLSIDSTDNKSPVDSCIDSDDSSTCSCNTPSECKSSYCAASKSTSDYDDDVSPTTTLSTIVPAADADSVDSAADCCVDVALAATVTVKDTSSCIAKSTIPQSTRSSNCKVNCQDNLLLKICSSASSTCSTVSSATKMSENIYPTVVGESIYGDFSEALNHLTNKLIATRSPEEIRGGGLLKYCRLQVLGYTPARWDEIKILEKYMCSRFFIDFPDVTVQRVKLANYLNSHFHDDQTKYDYLMILHKVVDESTVCLMGHERRQTLALIEEFAYHYYYQEQQQRSHHLHQQQQHLHHHHHPHSPQSYHHHHMHHPHAHYSPSIHSLPNSNQTSMPMHSLHPSSTQFHHIIRSNSYSSSSSASPSQHSQSHASQQQQQSTYELSPCQVTFYHSPQSNCHATVSNCSSLTHSTAQQQQQQQQQSISQEMQGNVPEHNSNTSSTSPANHVHATLLMTSNGHYYYAPYPPSTYSTASPHVHHHQGQLPPGHHHHHHHHHSQNGHVASTGHHSPVTSSCSSSSSSSSSMTSSAPSTAPSTGNSGFPCYNCPCCLGQWMSHCL